MPVNRSTRAAQNYCHKIRKAPLGASENIRCLGWGFFFVFYRTSLRCFKISALVLATYFLDVCCVGTQPARLLTVLGLASS